MQREVKEVFVHDRIFGYIVELAKATRENEWTELGLSPRGTVALTAMAKACAWLNGREYVVPSDVQEIFPCVTEHRIILNMKAKVGHIKRRTDPAGSGECSDSDNETEILRMNR